MTECDWPFEIREGLSRGSRSWFFFLLFLALASGMFAPGTLLAAGKAEAASVAVIFNASDPTSVALAKYYAERREIPKENLVGLACPQTEEISRVEYEATIARPLSVEFVNRGWWKRGTGDGAVLESRIRYAVLMRGMPLKVRPEPGEKKAAPGQAGPVGSRDEASVDSELSCLGLGPNPRVGVVPNPYFRRFTPIADLRGMAGMLLVCRLDGLTDISVRGMIDDAISTERDGLWGWGYLDARGIRSGGYAEGDEWMSQLAKDMRGQGIPVLLDEAPETLPAGYPVTDAAVYYGWYAANVNGPFALPTFRFRPGAIAVHIHSFSASTLRSAQSGWVAPLVEKGAAAVLGNVYEPYLTLTSHLDVFQDRLMEGFTFGESAYMSLRALSWMSVCVGDPLYRPYAKWRNGTPVPVAQLTSWELYRQIVKGAGGKVEAAQKELTEAAQKRGNSLFLEALADVMIQRGQTESAFKVIDQALAIEKKPLIVFRLELEKAALLRSTGKKGQALALLAAMKGRAPGPDQARLIEGIQFQLLPPASPVP